MVAHETIVINGNRVFGCQALEYADKAVPIRIMLEDPSGVDSAIVNVVAATR